MGQADPVKGAARHKAKTLGAARPVYEDADRPARAADVPQQIFGHAGVAVAKAAYEVSAVSLALHGEVAVSVGDKGAGQDRAVRRKEAGGAGLAAHACAEGLAPARFLQV